jgi:hypothetical protein
MGKFLIYVTITFFPFLFNLISSLPCGVRSVLHRICVWYSAIKTPKNSLLASVLRKSEHHLKERVTDAFKFRDHQTRDVLLLLTLTDNLPSAYKLRLLKCRQGFRISKLRKFA